MSTLGYSENVMDTAERMVRAFNGNCGALLQHMLYFSRRPGGKRFEAAP